MVNVNGFDHICGLYMSCLIILSHSLYYHYKPQQVIRLSVLYCWRPLSVSLLPRSVSGPL